MAANEDVEYTVSNFATPEDEEQPDTDQPNKSVLLEVQKYLGKQIDRHNTLDLIDLAESLKMTPTQQIAVHQLVVGHLKVIKTAIDNKLKELK